MQETDYDVHICVVTETHLLDKEVENCRIPGYRFLHKDGRYANKGGVAIFLRSRVSGRKLPQAPKPEGDICACSCLIYTGPAADGAVRLTGLYVPPSADATPEMLECLVNPAAQTIDSQGEVLSHLLVGDFNPYTWLGKSDQLYHEWTGENGLWELSDPPLATHKKGHALDKFILLPGTNVPDEWLPPQACDWLDDSEGGAAPDPLGEKQKEDDSFYPALTYEHAIIADHHPVMLRLKDGREASPPVPRTLNLAELDHDKWRERDEVMLAHLAQHKAQMDTAAGAGNPTNLLNIITQGIRNCFQDYYGSRGGARQEKDPFAAFCQKHHADPNYPLLIKADMEGDESLKRNLMDEMARDG